MATDVILPKIGFAMTEGILSEWLVQDGAHVTEGAAIYSVESDKSTTEVEAPASGVLRILKKVGETYPVGTVLGAIE
jgi:pyruvate/2-oxoglutarate dehydrogenase complex dihydrolipoamide acyltransferase (E2) component